MTESDLCLTPLPNHVELTGGSLALAERVRISCPGCEREGEGLASSLQSLGFLCEAPDSNGSVQEINLQLQPDLDLGREGYALTITPESISIRAPERAGVFYGIQTLRQLLSPPPAELPCLNISDRPSFDWRGMHLDVSRHFFDTRFVKRYIDLLAQHKLNVFHWHLTDDDGWRLQLDAHPDLTDIGAWRGPGEALPPSYGSGDTRYGGYYSKADVQQVLAYARDRHVTVLPEIDVPGHCKPVAVCYPKVLCDGDISSFKSVQEVTENLLCAGKEASFDLMEDVIGEVADLFPGPYLHMGGDERPEGPWEQCPRCAERIRAENLSGADELQGYFMERMRQIVEKNGKQMIGWNEITHGDIVSRRATVMAWQDPEKGADAAKLGYPVIMAPAQHTYFDLAQSEKPEEPGLRWAGVLTLEQSYRWRPVPAALDPESARRIRGVHGCLWAETLESEERADYMLLPRLCALSEIAWTRDEHQSWPNFLRRLSNRHLDRLREQGFGFRELRV